MSSSRVIKSSGLNDLPIRDFLFEVLDDQVKTRDMLSCNVDFVPFASMNCSENTPYDGSHRSGTPAADPVQEEALVIAGELQPCVTEEEMNAHAQEAYERGFEEGQRQAERGLSNVFKALREAIEEVYAIREQIFRDSEEDLLKLSILVAGKIIRQEINHDRRILSNVVAAALDNTSERDEVTIRLNPEDYKLVNSHKQLYLSGLGEDKVVNLKPDDAVSVGGCIVDTVMGEIDARLETQLDEIHKRLAEERGELTEVSGNLLNDREQYAYEES